MQHRRIGLDNAALRGRVRGYTTRPIARVPARTHVPVAKSMSDIVAQPVAKQYQQLNITQARASSNAATNIYAQPITSDVAVTKHSAAHNHQITKANNNLSRQLTIATTHSTTFKSSANISLPKVPTLPSPKAKGFKSIFYAVRHTSSKQKKGAVIIASIILLMSVGIGVNVRSMIVTDKIEAQAGTVHKPTDEGDHPDTSAAYSEDQPTMTSVSQYKVAADMPRMLSINKIGIFSKIKRVNIDASGQVGTPKNIYDVGWYDGSAKPGEPGAVFIDGHVSGPTARGVFYNLKNLVQGDVINIEKGDGQLITYKVVASELFAYDGVDMAKVLRPYDSNKQGLNLMTCTGKFNKATQSYEKRLVVYAVRSN